MQLIQRLIADNFSPLLIYSIKALFPVNSRRVNLIFISLLVGIVGWVSFEMYSRSQQELLWGYRPLVLFSAGWAIFVLALKKRVTQSENRNRWLVLSTLSGLILGVGFPEIIPTPFLMFVAFVPLLVVEDEIQNATIPKKFWTTFKLAYHTFITWNIITTYWVANASVGAGLFAIIVNSFLMCIPFMLYHVSRKAMPKLSFFAFISFWIVFEYNHLNWDLTWPWLNLGNSFAEYPSWVQWYEYTGTFGGCLWILLMNILIFQHWKTYKSTGLFKLNSSLIQIILVLIIPIGISLIIYYGHKDQGRTTQVATVQPNFEPHFEKFTIPKPLQMTRALELSNQVVDSSTDFLVFPEATFGYVETHRINQYSDIRRLIDFVESNPQTTIISGVNAYTEFLPGEPHTINTRTNVNNRGDTTYYETLNIALQLTAEQDNIPIYKKSKLVPGVERFPYQWLLFVFKPIVDELGGTTAGVGTQDTISIFNTPNGKIGTAICYESVFGAYFAGYIKKGAEAVFIVTNDGWWDNTAGHRQHLHFASLRAIETRRSIARSAYTGISAFVNQRGDILKATKYNEAVAIKDTISLNTQYTFYVIWGDIIARIALFSSILLLLNMLVRSWQKRVMEV